MSKRLPKAFRDKAEALGWHITECDDIVEFENFTSYGQDIFVDAWGDTFKAIAGKLWDYADGYDVSEETYLWLDSSGHGKNGAPYDMADVLADMEEAKAMFWELAELAYNAA